MEVEEFEAVSGENPHSLGEPSFGEDKNTQWICSDGVYSSNKSSKILKKLPAGTYTVFQTGSGSTHAEEIEVECDELYTLPNDATQAVIKEIDDFWQKAEKFKTAKVTHKRGILFVGPPGTGKTSTINLLTKSLVERGGLVFYIDTNADLYIFTEFVHSHLREVEPDRPVITVIEDIDKFMDGGSIESTLLNLLDGPDSFDHNVTVATTNRVDELNDLILRPSRFDRHIAVDAPTIEVKEAFLIHKGLTPEEAKSWAKDTRDYSIAEVKELFISVKLLDMSYEAAKKILKDQGETGGKKTYAKKAAKVGF
jgi:ATP-dependent 26S proteasome regulatory subunit